MALTSGACGSRGIKWQTLAHVDVDVEYRQVYSLWVPQLAILTDDYAVRTHFNGIIVTCHVVYKL